MAGTWVFDEQSLRDFISIVAFHAPDQFPVEDYLEPDEQLNLDRAIQELRQGLRFAQNLRGNEAASSRAQALVSKAANLYASNQVHAGTQVMYELEECLGYRVGER
jgi:hypothetical protein